MSNKSNQSEKSAELRRRVEEVSREKFAQPSEDLVSLSPEETRQMLYTAFFFCNWLIIRVRSVTEYHSTVKS